MGVTVSASLKMDGCRTGILEPCPEWIGKRRQLTTTCLAEDSSRLISNYFNNLEIAVTWVY